MADLTVGSVITRLDALLPNQYTAEEKRRWLREAEGFVLQEIRQPLEGTAVPPLPDPFTDTVVLSAAPPWDRMYLSYLEKCIHTANGELERANNAAAEWNSAFLSYHDAVLRSHRRGAAALKLM